MTTAQSTQQKGSTIKKILVFLFIATAILVFAWAMLPQGYSTDTTKIGKGKPAVVLIYDVGNGGSDHLMGSITKVRGEFEGQVEFILVDVNAPGGRAFANANAVPAASALFLSRDGKRITVIYPPQEDAALNKIIRQAFNL